MDFRTNDTDAKVDLDRELSSNLYVKSSLCVPASTTNTKYYYIKQHLLLCGLVVSLIQTLCVGARALKAQRSAKI